MWEAHDRKARTQRARARERETATRGGVLKRERGRAVDVWMAFLAAGFSFSSASLSFKYYRLPLNALGFSLNCGDVPLVALLSVCYTICLLLCPCWGTGFNFNTFVRILFSSPVRGLGCPTSLLPTTFIEKSYKPK